MMRKVLHVAVREFLATVLTKGFLFGLLLMPVIIVVAIGGTATLIDEEAPRIEGEVAVIDPTGKVYERLRDSLRPEAIAERRDDFEERVEEELPEGMAAFSDGEAAERARRMVLDAMLGEVPRLEVVELGAGVEVEDAKEPLREGEGNDPGRLALVVVHEDAVTRRPGEERYGKYDLFVREKLDDRLQSEIERRTRDAIVDARVEQAGLEREFVNALTRVGRVRSTTVTEEGEKATNEVLNLLMPMAFMLLLFASVMTGGQSLMTTTVEEKSSRVVELLLSAVSPMQLMTGKILGQMCVGFLVLAVYGGVGVGALVSFALLGVLDGWLLFYLVVFYVIAYFVVASMLAAIGAAVNEMREAQSLMGPVMIILIVPWVLWLPISRNPDSLFSVVTSFLPPLNPFVMMIRLASTTPPPWWQAWLSILVGAASAYAAVWFAAKVFRIGVLMYGKPPNFRTLIRWVRMA